MDRWKRGIKCYSAPCWLCRGEDVKDFKMISLHFIRSVKRAIEHGDERNRRQRSLRNQSVAGLRFDPAASVNVLNPTSHDWFIFFDSKLMLLSTATRVWQWNMFHSSDHCCSMHLSSTIVVLINPCIIFHSSILFTRKYLGGRLATMYLYEAVTNIFLFLLLIFIKQLID